MRKLLVLGGSGFVGQSLCAEALQRGWRVSSLSRTGRPNPMDPKLADVTWFRGSASDPSSYALNEGILKDVDYVIHSIGLLFAENTPQPRTPRQLSVETCLTALGAISGTSVRAFGYISAAQVGGPLMRSLFMSNYYKGKSDVEEMLEKSTNGLERVVIARPGFMYGPGRWHAKYVALFYNIGTWLTAGLFPRAMPVGLLACSLLDELDADKRGLSYLEVPKMLARFH